MEWEWIWGSPAFVRDSGKSELDPGSLTLTGRHDRPNAETDHATVDRLGGRGINGVQPCCLGFECTIVPTCSPSKAAAIRSGCRPLTI